MIVGLGPDQAGRREIFRILTPDLDFQNWRVALVKMAVDCESQIYFDETADLRTLVDQIGTKSFTLSEELWQGDRRRSRGTAVYVYFDCSTKSSKVIPEDVKVPLKQL